MNSNTARSCWVLRGTKGVLGIVVGALVLLLLLLLLSTLLLDRCLRREDESAGQLLGEIEIIRGFKRRVWGGDNVWGLKRQNRHEKWRGEGREFVGAPIKLSSELGWKRSVSNYHIRSTLLSNRQR